MMTINRGSTCRAELTWPNGSGGGADLTGATVDTFDNTTGLLVAPTIINAATGRITLHLTDETTLALPTGEFYVFRLRINWSNGDASTTPLIPVQIK